MDAELETLLAVLNDIQKAVGGKVVKKAKEGGKVDKFMDVKQTMIARIVEVRKLIATTRNQTPGQELQPKEVIASNAQVREYLRQLNEDYKELERLFSKEKNKRKSKFAPEELEVRGQVVNQMLREVQELKEVSLAGYIRKGNVTGNNMAGLIVPMEESEAFQGPMGAMPMNTGMTEDHRVQLQQIQQRDKDMDRHYLDQIERGVEDLRDIALRANEGVRTTNVMLENLEQKIIDVQDHLDRVNKKMKTTLQQVGRRSDKLCIDIICIVILLGMIGLLYNLMKNSKNS
ncbi:soluble nsf attachment protein receptor [Nannochloropsis oceanica]